MHKIELFLLPKEGKVIPTPGYVFRGFLMNVMNELKPELTHYYHEPNKIKDYAVNPFVKFKENQIDLTIICFQEPLYELLLKALMNPHSEFRLGPQEYYLSNLARGPIDLELVFKNARPMNAYSLYFPRPTYFNTGLGNYAVRLPIPEILYSNLSSLWNAISKKTADQDVTCFLEWVRTHVYVSSHEIKTVSEEIGAHHAAVAGFIGTVHFKIKKPNKHFFKKGRKVESMKEITIIHEGYCRWIDFLNKLAEYTNVGANRTAGFGVVLHDSN